MVAATTRRWALLTLLLMLTAITHYYSLFLLAIFILMRWGLQPKDRLPLFWSSSISALLVSPWLWRVWMLGQSWAIIQSQPNAIGNKPLYILSLQGPLHNYLLIVLAIIGGYVVIRDLRRNSAYMHPWTSLLLWILFLIFLLGPWQIPPFRSDHAALLLFLPTVLLATEALSRLRKPQHRWLVVLLLLFWGMWATRNIVRPDTVLAHASDVDAIAWIDSESAPDATFLIDVTPWFGIWRGADGGWWIMPLTEHKTVLPPMAYTWGQREAIWQYVRTAEQLADVYGAPSSSYCVKLLTLMRNVEAEYYYTRSQKPRSCPLLTPVYAGHGDMVDSLQIYHRVE